MPELKSGIEDILQDADASIRYYDITGREVTAPQRGQLLITSDHRKIIY